MFHAGNPWTVACQTSAGEAYCLSQPLPWPSQIDSRYQPARSLTQSMHVDPSPGQLMSTTIPVSWPTSAEGVMSTAIQHANARHDSFIQTCYPQSAFLPSEYLTAFSAPQLEVASFRPVYEMSSGHSEYSVSSHASAVASPSPYAHSEGYFQTSGSPAIKIEDDYSHTSSRAYSVSQSTSPPTRHVDVKPGDVYSSPQIEGDQLPVTPPPTAKVEEDLKPSPSSSRYPDASRKPLQRSSGQDRNKRGYTTPMNAVCVCDTCGKLFQRLSNLKAHMETHRPDREQPWACQYHECERRFVRKTDMTRHQESVS